MTVLLALTSALAGPYDVPDALPSSAEGIVHCTSAAYPQDLLGRIPIPPDKIEGAMRMLMAPQAAGVATDKPIAAVMGGSGIVWARLPVADPVKFDDALANSGLMTGPDGTLIDKNGNALTVAHTDGFAELRFGSWDDAAPDRFSKLDAMWTHADKGPSCVIGLQTDRQGPGTMVMQVYGPDRAVRMVAPSEMLAKGGGPMGPMGFEKNLDRPMAPATPPHGSSAAVPQMAMRFNVDGAALVGDLLAPDLLPTIGAGMEVAVFQTMPPSMAMVLPVANGPKALKQASKAWKKAGLDASVSGSTWDLPAEAVLKPNPASAAAGERVYVSALADALVVGSSAELAAEVQTGGGLPWFADAASAARPGVLMRLAFPGGGEPVQMHMAKHGEIVVIDISSIDMLMGMGVMLAQQFQKVADEVGSELEEIEPSPEE